MKKSQNSNHWLQLCGLNAAAADNTKHEKEVTMRHPTKNSKEDRGRNQNDEDEWMDAKDKDISGTIEKLEYA
eukprot:6978502-Ditylum_brightwellii.AAC.1